MNAANSASVVVAEWEEVVLSKTLAEYTVGASNPLIFEILLLLLRGMLRECRLNHLNESLDRDFVLV